MNKKNFIDQMYDKLLSEKVKASSERAILTVAIASYFLHLMLILFKHLGWIEVESKLLQSPIAAIYTPFSFILVYEVYLLVFFIPKSISFYIGKQYEIITLIVIRRLFKDLAALEFSSEWFRIKGDLQFTFDVLTSMLLFVLIYFFFKNIPLRSESLQTDGLSTKSMQRFLRLKRLIACGLVPILGILATFALANWIITTIGDYKSGLLAFNNLNNIFFEDFFTILIMTDVLLLLASFYYSDSFHKIIRNSGFVISTILIKISFSAEGIVNNALIVGAVLFGLLMLLIHNLFEKRQGLGIK